MSRVRSSPLLGSEALMLADPALTRKSRKSSTVESQLVGHTDEDSAVAAQPAAATGNPAESNAAASPAVAQQGDDGSIHSSSGCGASVPGLCVDDISAYRGIETPPSRAQRRIGTAAESHSSDFSAHLGPPADPYAALAPSSAYSSPRRSVTSGRGGEVDMTQHIREFLLADVPEPIRRSLCSTAAAVADLRERYVDYAMHFTDVQESIYQQQQHAAELTAIVTSDLQAMQTRLEQAEERASEWADRARAADERAAAVDVRVAALEARLAAEEDRSADHFKTAMLGVNLVGDRLDRLLSGDHESPQQRRQFPYTPGTAYASAQQMPSATYPAISEPNLRALGGSAARHDDDARSRVSAQSARSLLRPVAAIPLPPRPSSVSGAPPSSATATVRDAPARPLVPPFSFSLADPTQAQDLVHQGTNGSLKEEARAQLDGAVREARNPQLWAVTQAVQARTDLTQQLAAERAERDVRAAATEAALQREQERLCAEREEVECSARAHELSVRQAQLEAQARELAAQRAAMRAEQCAWERAKTELALSVAGRGGDGSESARSMAPRRRSGGGDGDGGDGSGDSSSTTASSSHASESGRSAGLAPAPVLTSAAAALSEWPGKPATVPLEGWFDARGYAITRIGVQIKEADLPKTTIIGTSMVPLVNLQKMLPSLIRESADAVRQRQRPMWPALITADDFGSNWFSSVVRAVINCIVSGGGDNYMVGSLAGEASEWQKEGEALSVSDTARLEWFFARIAKFLELRRPAELAADLVRWVVKPGLPLKDFVYEFSTASTAVLSADSNQDNFVLTALMEICRQQYSVTAAGWAHINANPRSYTTRNLLEILRGQAELAKYLAVAREDDQPIYPKDLRSYSKGALAASGGGLPSKLQQTASALADKNARRTADQLRKQEAQISYMIFAINHFSSSTGAARTCFNCGSDQHVFARCEQPYSAANWNAVVEKLPWVAKFRPSGNEDFKQLCAKALERAARGERGRSAAWAHEQRRGGGGRGRGGRGGRGGDH